MRALAARSANSAREIRLLIEASDQKTQVGAEQVDEARRRGSEVAERSQNISILISEMAETSLSLQRGIDELHGTLAHIDDATQQNAAMVEQTAAAAESLRQQAERVAKAVDWFHTSSSKESR